MKVYHGTAAYNLESFQQGVELSPRHHGRDAFCVSDNFQVAALFALRKTPAIDLSKTGIVIEFNAHLLAGAWDRYKSHGVLQEEHEIRIYDESQLEFVAYHRYNSGAWDRHSRP